MIDTTATVLMFLLVMGVGVLVGVILYSIPPD